MELETVEAGASGRKEGRDVRLPLAMLCLLAFATPGRAEDGWVLWEHPQDVKRQRYGEWRRGQAFEAERWCRGAMTVAINQALTPEALKASELKGVVVEYQCFPANVDPRGAKRD